MWYHFTWNFFQKTIFLRMYWLKNYQYKGQVYAYEGCKCVEWLFWLNRGLVTHWFGAMIMDRSRIFARWTPGLDQMDQRWKFAEFSRRLSWIGGVCIFVTVTNLVMYKIARIDMMNHVQLWRDKSQATGNKPNSFKNEFCSFPPAH